MIQIITLIDITKAIETKIKNALIGTTFTIKPTPEDVVEAIVRPAIKVRLEGSKNGKFNALCKEKNITVRIYFWAKDKNKYSIDNLKMQEILENAFLDDIEINENFINIESLESEVSDSILICSFDLYFIEEIVYEDTSEPMEELFLNLE